MDRYDAPKLSPAGLAARWLSFHALDEDGRGYAFRSLPADVGDQMTIALGIETTEAGPYALSWTLPEARLSGGGYYLRDTRTGKVTELRDGQNYRFEIALDEAVPVASALSGWTEDSVPGPGDSSVRGKWTDEGVRFELIFSEQPLDENHNLPTQITLNQN